MKKHIQVIGEAEAEYKRLYDEDPSQEGDKLFKCFL